MKPVYVIQTISLKELLNARRQTKRNMLITTTHPFSDWGKIFSYTMMMQP